jgi:hypothetical protein
MQHELIYQKKICRVFRDKAKEKKSKVTSHKKEENKKGIKNHKKAANHFEAASKFHLDAAKHHEEGNHKKAAKSTIEAHGHANLAREAQKEDVNHHVLTA